eukprot:CAMPEP_0182418860 /NCGR_PEP_ID=MMETSP1167-20130531/3240_1 /TAXON_ID=2988 /ORGANISM="Mallomonas Sp, Strain CCMP3275" /LENGTH=388 /DNA_ID=CAMNT_0024593307 /DNA_START=78 /DNA_END=1244 /DNA_ORIENTATION=-
MLGLTGFHDTVEVVFWRGCFQWILVTFLVYYRVDVTGKEKSSILGDSLWMKLVLFTRSVCGFIGIVFAFLAVNRLPLGDAMVIMMLSPLFSSIAAVFVLGEPFRTSERVASLVSLIGVILVAKPTVLFGNRDSSDAHPSHFLNLDLLGVLYALACAFSGCGVFISLRLLGTSAKMPWPTVALVQSVFSVVMTGPAMYITGQTFRTHFSTDQCLWMMCASVIGACSQLCLTYGMQREKSALAGAMRMSDVVFSFVWQASFTEDAVSSWSLGGASLVMLSVLLMVFEKIREVHAAEKMMESPGTCVSSVSDRETRTVEHMKGPENSTTSEIPSRPSMGWRCVDMLIALSERHVGHSSSVKPCPRDGDGVKNVTDNIFGRDENAEEEDPLL